MVAIAAKLSMEYYRFLSWARIAGAFQGQAGSTPRRTAPTEQPGDMADRLRALIEDAVAQIAGLLKDVSRIAAKYTPEKEPSPSPNPLIPPDGRGAPPSVGLGLSVTLPLLGVQHNPALISKMLQQKGRAETLKRKTTFRLRYTFGTKPWGLPPTTLHS
jgi:hypothetical protein